jgi:tRNA threonylcarbamoyladenosine modification (KEOPS) complex Cgi121 subunit
LQLQTVIIGPSTHIVGLFGITLTESLSPESLFKLLKPLTDTSRVKIQLLNADFIASHDHLLFATIHALTSFQRSTNRASTLPTEILRFAAAQRQISKALDTLGLDRHTKRIGGVLVNSDSARLRGVYQEFLRRIPCQETPEVLDITSSTKLAGIQELFQITDLELEAVASSPRLSDRQQAVQKIIYDRCALLAITH